MPEEKETIRYKTTKHTDENGRTVVIYYQTAIVIFDDEEIVLNTGDYRTATTQRRMNFVSKQFDLGYHVFTKQSEWFVEFNDQVVDFTTDQVKLSRMTG